MRFNNHPKYVLRRRALVALALFVGATLAFSGQLDDAALRDGHPTQVNLLDDSSTRTMPSDAELDMDGAYTTFGF